MDKMIKLTEDEITDMDGGTSINRLGTKASSPKVSAGLTDTVQGSIGPFGVYNSNFDTALGAIGATGRGTQPLIEHVDENDDTYNQIVGMFLKIRAPQPGTTLSSSVLMNKSSKMAFSAKGTP